MSPELSHPISTHLGAEHFATTHWSVVLAAGRDQSQTTAAAAMEQLCRGYWYPLYAFVRRLGYGPPDAQDLTQAFFVHLLTTNLVGKAQAENGKFRSFLLASMKNFVCSERDRVQAQKRGGGQVVISLDEQAAEQRFADEPKEDSTPESIYERTWAITVLEQALVLIEQEYQTSGKQEIFDQLRTGLLGEKASVGYADVAAKLGATEGAVKMMVQRMRRRYRECLRAVVAQTVGNTGEIDQELRHLVRVLNR